MLDPADGGLDGWLTGLLEWDAQQSNDSTVTTEVVSYGDHPAQFVELWHPAESAQSQALVSLHGGYFLAEYDLTLHRAMCRTLAGLGFVVANVEYRRVGAGGDFGATTDDVWAAAETVSSRLPGQAITAFGHSAGGYLAEWLAPHPAVETVIGLGAVTDLVGASRAGWDGGAIESWVGATPEADPKSYALADLTARLPSGTSRVLLHGDADTAVGVVQSRSYASVLESADEPVRYLELLGMGHYGYLDPREAEFKVLLEVLDAEGRAPRE